MLSKIDQGTRIGRRDAAMLVLQYGMLYRSIKVTNLMAGSPDRHDDDGEGAPRGVKVSAAIAVVLFVVFVIVHLAGGGMTRHTP
ncbi:hypothetical protein BGM19_35840 [Streptomyces agglomeratus]|uniref:hypothetical protein n=1 Tax=Streptomyces agglomeratus TaxID=285458 RepID=UPI00086C159D|nr:hypothetical protein [Streptomyces agglomeratus]OEJ62569.1 hypothetical protein BGM19_35840 [Streptomyces agglomeratus]